MQNFKVIGLNDNSNPNLSSELLDLISKETVFSGGKRHYQLVKALLPKKHTWIDITIPLDHVFEQYKGIPSIVVFASGDPLFFGFAITIQKRLPNAKIQVFPSFNSLQMLAHKLVMQYDNLTIVSLTGRPWQNLDKALIERAPKIGILTDKEHTPSTIAKRALEYGFSNYKMYLGEKLGSPLERVLELSLEQALKEETQQPNCIILEQETFSKKKYFGIPDNLFTTLDQRPKMITKMPIRLLSLSKLDLNCCLNFWDIGFCTGSISIEAKMQFPHLNILAFEVREEGRQLMEINSKKFGTPGIETIIGDFLDIPLDDLAKPDAVFIGGHNGKLIEIVSKIVPLLSPCGRIVFNSVSIESKNLFKQACAFAKINIEDSTEIRVDNNNTITIMLAKNK